MKYPEPGETVFLPARGLTKREHFAAMALQGFISTLTINRDDHADLLSQTAVKYADALIAELAKEQP